MMLPKSDRMVYVVNEDGASVLHGYDFAAGGAFDVPVLPYGVVGAMTPNHDGLRLALTMNRPVEASNLYEIDLAAGTLTGLGESMLGGIPTESMVEPELIHFDTFDGRKILARGCIARARARSPGRRCFRSTAGRNHRSARFTPTTDSISTSSIVGSRCLRPTFAARPATGSATRS
ncbi:MAG: hypothetical protein HND48_17185 [Chloroflexi bacterium]|nr:hypothetical protein [Chloroflexota bacterium]